MRTEDIATRKLRKVIERPQVRHLWGQPSKVTPRLITRIFGDGKCLLGVQPLDTRPNYFVVRVDSSTKDPRDDFPGADWPRIGRPELSLLDQIMDAAEEEYGYHGDEEELDAKGNDARPFPVVDWGIGCTWGEPAPIAEWLRKSGTAHAPRRARRRRHAR